MLPVLMGLQGFEPSQEELNLIREVEPAGFVLFSRNIESPQQTRALTDTLRNISRHTPIIAIDQEGGRVVRTAGLGLALPSARTLSETHDSSLIVEMAHIIATSLRYLGINLDFAPVLDICHDDSVSNALPGRCWGNNASDVISYAGMFNRNLSHFLLPGCGKHFPGMGRASVDPHHDLPVIEASLDDLLQSDFIPFSALAPELSSIMTAHILLPSVDSDLPASLSPAITRQLLRNQLGYEGVVMTDDLCMGAISTRYGVAHAAIMAIKASCDLPLICHDPMDSVREFAILMKQEDMPNIVHDSQKRIERLISKLPVPLPFNQSKWEETLTRSADLCRKTNDLAKEEASTPSSPVQFM